MANKTSVIIKSVDDNNKEVTRSVTDVSSTATTSQLKAFAQALNSTSTNTYKSSSRVQTIDLDTTSPTKPQRPGIFEFGDTTVTQNPAVLPYSSLIGDDPSDFDLLCAVSVTGSIDESKVKMSYTATSSNVEVDFAYMPSAQQTSSSINFSLAKGSCTPESGDDLAIHFFIPEDITYAETEFVLSITGGNS